MIQRLSLLLFVIILYGCKTLSDDERMIKMMESNLRPHHSLSGDDGWTIDERMRHYDVPGMSLAIVHAGEIMHNGYYGTTDKISGNDVVDKTLFQAASISKPVSALAALLAIEQGRLNLDSNINSFLTSWQLEDNEFTADKHVHLGGLLSHSGGISIHGFRGYSIEEQVPSLLQVLDSNDPANSWVVRPIVKPGTQYRYSGGGYCIVQQVMLDVYGQDFNTTMQESVLRPLGMYVSSFQQPLPDSLLRFAASGYLPDGKMVFGRRHTYPELAAAGLWTNAFDLAKFGLELQQGYQGNPTLANRSTYESMLTPYFENVGLGIFLDDRKGEIYFQHGGWNEGFSSQLTFHRDRGYGVVVMINANQPQFIEEVVRSVAYTFDWLNYLPPVHDRLENDADAVQKISGRYLYSADQVVEIFARGDSLFLQYLNEDPEELFAIDDNVYVRRERTHYVQFLPAQDGLLHLVFKEDLADSTHYNHPQIADTDSVAFEYILAKRYEKARAAYFEIEREDPRSSALDEYRIYHRAEKLSEQNELIGVLEMLKINADLHPGSYVAFHRLADAYMAIKDEEMALRNYKKSVKFYPQNTEAREMIEKLENPKVEI